MTVLSPAELCLYSIVASASGVAIGAVGVGGVLLVPSLVFLGADVHSAVLAVIASFCVGSVVAIVSTARSGALPVRLATASCAGAVPGSVAGALILPLLPADLVVLCIGAVATISATMMLCSARALVRARATAELAEAPAAKSGGGGSCCGAGESDTVEMLRDDGANDGAAAGGAAQRGAAGGAARAGSGGAGAGAGTVPDGGRVRDERSSPELATFAALGCVVG